MKCPNCGVENDLGAKFCYRCNWNLQTAYSDWPSLVQPEGAGSRPVPREQKVGFFEKRLICAECGRRFRALKGGLCESCYQQWLERAYYGHKRMQQTAKHLRQSVFGRDHW